MIKALVIDDQEFCVEMLSDLLQDHCPKSVQLVGTCSSGREALRQIPRLKPDVLFLDVEMPGMTGFEMLKKISKRNFEVIFTTSYDKYMVDAMRHSAIDYLMKPIKPEELKESVNRLLKKHNNYSGDRIQALFDNLRSRKNRFNKIALPTRDGLVFIAIDQILQCESDSNYTTIHLANGETMLVTKTLKDIETLIDSDEFFRIHHSHLVNLNHVKRYIKGAGGYVILSNDSSVNVSRNRKDDFIEHFSRL
jgi:two-component system LytT family response regulator